VFFTNFDGMLAVADSADAQAAPVLHALLPHSVNVGVRQRYERQMCLPATAISRLMGPRLVRSVAVTGGDPYLMTGADVAVLFQALNTPALRMMIDGRVATSGAADKEAKVVKGEVDGVAYSGMVSPDRAICSYVATLGDTVVVTNSLAQLKRLVSVEKQETRSLASLDEYTFFRDRYRRGAADEQALLVISDATIRRWCSAKWRIAASRTVRAAAVIADGQAEQMDRLVAGSLDPAVKVNYRPLLDAGQMTLGRRGIQSDRYGSLAFHTPIIEQEFTHVTMREADMYERWRSGYQNNWSNYFDPIAVRLHMSKDKMAADVTVMPLIERSDYRQFIELCGAAQLAAGSGDPHPGALAHFVMALDPDSQALKYYSSLFNHFGGLKTNVLGWIGGSVALYAEDDPFWDEMAKAENQQEFVDKNLHRLPIALQVEVRDPIKMAVFLTAGRTMIDGVVPEMTVWETRKHRDQAYVRITKSPNVGNGRGLGAAMPEKMVLCYAPADDVLIVSLNEEVLKKALDRRADRLAAAKDAGKPAASPWLGQQIAVHLNHRALLFHQLIEGSRYEREMQRLAWDNLPVLNEWHRRFPDAEPVALHERIWHQQLVCPGGGTYRWNEAWQTMESTVYGHPGEPKKGPTLAESFKQFSSADFGLTFEKNGLRAKAELTRAAEKGNVEKK
jgi:hypothetical protein